MRLKRREIEEILRLVLEKNRELEGNNRQLVRQKRVQQAIIATLRTMMRDLQNDIKDELNKPYDVATTADLSRFLVGLSEQLERWLGRDLAAEADKFLKEGKCATTQ